MSYRGDIALGNTIDIKFCTVQSTGAPTTLSGSPVISAYVGNSTTEITAGITLTADFDGRTGFNNVRVVASGGNGFATATDIDLVITTGTVNSVSAVGYVVGSFSIENRSGLRPTTAGRTLVVDAAGLADANVVKVGPTGAGTAQTARDIGASVVVGSISANAITATSIQADAITAAKIADGAIDAATFAADTFPFFAVCSYGALTAGGSGTFTLAVGQRLNVVAGDAFYVAGKGCRIIATYNSGTGAGTTESAGDSAFAASDVAIVYKVPKATLLSASNFSGVIDVNVEQVNNVQIIGDGSATPFQV